jgi:hypothetical protein
MKFWFLAHGYLPGVNNGKAFGVEVVGIDCNSVLSVSPRHDKRATITGAGDNCELMCGICVILSLIPHENSHSAAWLDVR